MLIAFGLFFRIFAGLLLFIEAEHLGSDTDPDDEWLLCHQSFLLVTSRMAKRSGRGRSSG